MYRILKISADKNICRLPTIAFHVTCGIMSVLSGIALYSCTDDGELYSTSQGFNLLSTYNKVELNEVTSNSLGQTSEGKLIHTTTKNDGPTEVTFANEEIESIFTNYLSTVTSIQNPIILNDQVRNDIFLDRLYAAFSNDDDISLGQALIMTDEEGILFLLLIMFTIRRTWR